MEGQHGDRSGSRKRERSKSPTTDFKKPAKVRNSRSTCKKNSRPVVDKEQSKITSFHSRDGVENTEKRGTGSNMADRDEANKGETLKPLSEFEKLLLEKLQGLDYKMENINKKLDDRMDHLESRMYVIEKSQDAQKKEIEEMKKQQSASLDLASST